MFMNNIPLYTYVLDIIKIMIPEKRIKREIMSPYLVKYIFDVLICCFLQQLP